MPKRPRPSTSSMKTIFETVHDGVIGRIVEPDDLDPGKPYAEQLEVRIGVDDSGERLSPDDFVPLARLVVLELHNYILAHYSDGDAGASAHSENPAPEVSAG